MKDCDKQCTVAYLLHSAVSDWLWPCNILTCIFLCLMCVYFYIRLFYQVMIAFHVNEEVFCMSCKFSRRNRIRYFASIYRLVLCAISAFPDCTTFFSLLSQCIFLYTSFCIVGLCLLCKYFWNFGRSLPFARLSTSLLLVLLTSPPLSEWGRYCDASCHAVCPPRCV